MDGPNEASTTGTLTLAWDIFIAYASPDRPLAERLHDLLKDKCRVFVDSRSLMLGDNWDLEVPRAQRASLVTVVLVTENTESRSLPRDEIIAAVQLARQNEHRVVPIFLGAASRQVDRIPYGLRPWQGINLDVGATQLPRAADRLAALIAMLSSEKGNGVWPPPRAEALAAAATSRLRLVFEQQPEYPFLGFSLLNEGSAVAHVTSIRVLKAVSLKDDHSLAVYFQAPVAHLEYSLDTEPIGSAKRVFGGDRVATIEPGAIDGFRIKFQGGNSINLLDLEIEYLTPGLPGPAVLLPGEVIVVHSPRTNTDLREIVTITRDSAIKAVLTPEDERVRPTLRWLTSSERRPARSKTDSPWIDCGLWYPLLTAGIGCSSRDAPEQHGNTCSTALGEDARSSTILLSFATLAFDGVPPEPFIREADAYVQDIALTQRGEPPSHGHRAMDVNSIDILRLVAANVDRLPEKEPVLRFYLRHLDELLLGGFYGDVRAYRTKALDDLIAIAGKRCVEYLIHVMTVDSELVNYLSSTLKELLDDDRIREEMRNLARARRLLDRPSHVTYWRTWLAARIEPPESSSLEWRPYSPRLALALDDGSPK